MKKAFLVVLFSLLFISIPFMASAAENNEEVDFILQKADRLLAIEVKSGKRQNNMGLSVFRNMYHPNHSLVVGGNAMPLEEFYRGNLEQLL